MAMWTHLKQLLPSLSRKTSHRKRSLVQRRRIRLVAEQLEDRLAPAITASWDPAGILTVNLSAAGDHAFLKVDAGNIDVGTSEGGTDIVSNQAGVTSLVIRDSGAFPNQAVTFSAGGAA